jgi:hypothetical protein
MNAREEGGGTTSMLRPLNRNRLSTCSQTIGLAVSCSTRVPSHGVNDIFHSLKFFELNSC